MEKQFDQETTFVSLIGSNKEDLYLLANLNYVPFDPGEILSVVINLSHTPMGKWFRIYREETWLTSMDRSKNGSLFAVSMEGELHSYKQENWSTLDLKCPYGLNAVWAATDDEVFVVGLKGERIQITENSINLTKDPKERRLNSVHGLSTKKVFAVGDEGLIWVYDGVTWIELEQVTNCNLLSVLCQSEKEIYIGGANGVLLKWNGKELIWLESPKITITSLAWYREELYAAAGLKGVYVLKEKGLEKVKDLTLYRLKTISDLLFGISGKVIFQFNGSEWWGGDLDL